MRIPISMRCALRCALDAIIAPRAARAYRRVQEQLPEHAVPFLSVRSAFAALIEALDLRPGDEVAMSAVTIGDMEMLPRAYGLHVVPVALDPVTLAPCPRSLAEAISPRTKVFVAAHLFGARPSLAASAAVAREHGVLVVADAAQALGADDPNDAARWRRDVDADVTFLSFGPIKTGTALGGGAAICRDAQLAQRLAVIQRGWARRPRRAHLLRGTKYALLSLVSRPVPYGALTGWLERRGTDPDLVLQRFTKGFGQIDTPEDLRRVVSHTPDAGLLTTMARRLRMVDDAQVDQRIAAGRDMAERLGRLVPGGANTPHARWLVPVSCWDEAERSRLRAELRAAGFDAVPIQKTNLVDLGARRSVQLGASDEIVRSGASSLDFALLLPAMYGMPRREADRLATVVLQVLGRGLRSSSAQAAAAPGSAAPAASPVSAT